jgi:hypothetical protein
VTVVHVEPVNDLVAHDCTGGALCDCVCGPDVEFVEGGGVLVTHHSLDGREATVAETASQHATREL